VLNASLPGANEFFNSLSSAGIDIGASSSTGVCPNDFENLNPPNLTMAHPFEVLMNWKVQVLSHTFRCDSNNCSWPQWIQYVNDMHDQLVAAALAVDAVQANTFNRINDNLRQLVQGSVLPPIDTLTQGLDCKFMHTSFNNVYSDLCYRQTPGLIIAVITWLVFGALCWICILVEFIIWRHLRDNLSIWLDFKNEHSSSKSGNIRVSPIAAAIPSPRHFAQATIGYRSQNILMH
jgi:hypothetical protein